MADWRYTATRCAVEGCERTRVRGWSTCRTLTHYRLGQSLHGAGRIEPIPAPPEHRPFVGTPDAKLASIAAGGNIVARDELARRRGEPRSVIQCPECEVSPPEIFESYIVLRRVSHWTHAVETPQGLSITEAGEHESEHVEDCRDDATFKCGGCGYSTDDPDDFLAESEDSE